MKISFFTLIIVLFSFAQIFCGEIEVIKLPNNVNSHFDEFPCFFKDEKLFFIRKEKNVFSTLYSKSPNFDETENFRITKKYFKLSGNFFSSTDAENSEFFIFSGKLPNRNDNDIFCFKRNKKNNEILQIYFPYNTDGFESHPQFISKGNKIVFVSEVTSETNRNTDIFISDFTNEKFEKPIDIKEVNTELNEITPFIDEQGNLYFSRFDTTNYNLYKAEKISDNIWSKPRRLPFPINTEYNELCPIVINNKIFFASDREKNISGFDIYSANLCLPVFLEISFYENPRLFSSFDKMLLLDSNENIIEGKYLGDNTVLSLDLLPNKIYLVKIYNECTKETYFKKQFKTLCLDTSYVKYVIRYNFPSNLTQEVNLPFFLSGYYKPITRYNLEQIKKLFDLNIIGTNDTTNYIEFPSPTYFDIGLKVEETLSNIVQQISYFTKMFQKGCIPQSKILKIEITGYADPRALSPKAKFFEESIFDDKMNFFLEKGTILSNDILSKLRAYFTAREIKNQLVKNFGYSLIDKFIDWEIKGGGIIKEEEDYLLLRKVNIKIYFENRGL
ncbi:MAG: hypothetical protein N2560_01925 [Ignavibacteria bacterium]|nr:hypothetical protein [Ignavibacteria bacterium]